ncbi:hypothetical protein AYO49_02465 [Verrucomicrobiaceae bacterium SCGC AG-212-N21]|nr:hypothetical protein AYO49_02465 [Verrucomicrobiaceae bacterium SCGC AG-212-N21]
MAILTTLATSITLHGADPIFSGPQIGEKTTGFQTLAIGGSADGTERDPVKDNAGAPTVIVFVHAIERSLIPLLRLVDEYGVQRGDRIKTEIVFLSADRIRGEQQVRGANGSLRLRAKVGLSLDGAEGPGNYGLNKDCMMTLVMARDNVVTANFGLVQPGISDAPAVIAALATTCGDEKPPTVAALTPEQPRARGMTATRGAAPPPRVPLDLTKLDYSSEAGLRASVVALVAEVEALRRELAQQRGEGMASDVPRAPIPGAAPTDARLVDLLREFIRPTNDDATVDRVLTDVKGYIKDDAGLIQQTRDGWVRVLHLNYGTAYARKTGREFLDTLKKP